MKAKPKIIVIVGPTASGKTAFSIRLAKEFNGEIVSADSRQVYKGLDIGTGKVTREEMQGVPHHLLDVSLPKETYTVANFVRDGRKAISQIISRGTLPIIVGGTFFYVDALLGRVVAPEVPPNPALREKLEACTAEELFLMLRDKDPTRADSIDRHNKRRLVRALEIVDAVGSVPQRSYEEVYDALILGIHITKEQLHNNIHTRLQKRLEEGMIEEVKRLLVNGLSYERLSELGIEYSCIAEYLQGKIDYETMIERIETQSRQYAKRQMTWLKRDTSITWIDPDDTETVKHNVAEFLQ